VPESELAALKRAMEVGFTKLDGHLDVIDEKLGAMAKTTDRHEQELEEARARRWPLPVLGALGALGGLASVAWSAVPHK
jgi:hypothetical protein